MSVLFKRKLCRFLVLAFLLISFVPAFAENYFRTATIEELEGDAIIFKAGGESSSDFRCSRCIKYRNFDQ